MQPTLTAFRQCPNSWRQILSLGLLTLAALNPPAFLLAQNPPVKFERFSPEQGLPANAVNWILQDQKGLMWFGTAEGLAKYDGYSFTVYNDMRFKVLPCQSPA